MANYIDRVRNSMIEFIFVIPSHFLGKGYNYEPG